MGSYRFKIILAGDEAVGKTSTILRFVHNTYSEMYKPTLGFQISVKNLNYKTPSNEDRIVIFSIWDIAGQGQFAGVRKGYYQGTDGVLLLFDLTRRKTFENAKFWADEIRTVAPAAPIVLVGNKADLPNQAVLAQELTYASKENKFASYAISSAATGRGVDEIFKLVSDAIINAISAAKTPEPVPVITVHATPVATPAPVNQEVLPPVRRSEAPFPYAEIKPLVQRQPPIIPQLQIKLPAVRNVPQVSPVEVTPEVTPPAPEIPRVEVKAVVVSPFSPPAPVKVSPEIESVNASPAPVETPVHIEPPAAPPVAAVVPVVVPVVTESLSISPAPVVVPETVKTQVPSTPPPFLQKAPEEEGQPPQPKKKSFWQRHFHRE